MHRPGRLLITAGVPVTLRTFLTPYADHYRARGWRVDAAAYRATEADDLFRHFDALHDVPWTRQPTDVVNLTAAPRALRAVVDRGDYDIVHAHDPVAGFVTRWALRSRRRRGFVRVVCTAHGFHFQDGDSPVGNLVYRLLERRAAGWCDRLIVMNDEDERATQHWPVDVVRMPGIGVDLSQYAPDRVSAEEVDAIRKELHLTPDDALFIVVAELRPDKRHTDALAALARCDRDNVVLALAGEGSEETALRTLARQLGVADRVRWLGWRSDVPALLRASVAVLLPSVREGLPRCILEAAALERPVVASDIRGTRELVNERTGLRVDVGDIDGIATAMAWIVDHPAEAEAMGRAARTAVAPYDLRHLLVAHDRLYAELLDESPRGRSATDTA